MGTVYVEVVFTVNYYEGLPDFSLNEDGTVCNKVVYATYCERVSETGIPYIQGYIAFNGLYRYGDIRKISGMEACHVENLGRMGRTLTREYINRPHDGFISGPYTYGCAKLGCREAPPMTI